MNTASICTWKRIAIAAFGGCVVLAALGLAQPATSGGPGAAQTPPSNPWEYAALTRTVTAGPANSGVRASDWRFCSPTEDLAGEEAILAKYGGKGQGAQYEVGIINGLAGKGWDLVTQSQSAMYEAKLHNGTTSTDVRTTTDQWWFKRVRTPPPKR